MLRATPYPDRVLSWPIALTVALALCAFLPAAGQAAQAAVAQGDGASQPTKISVEVRGRVPGLTKAELRRYVAERMNAAHLGAWQFLPAADASCRTTERVVWTFTTHPSATGTVRNYGFSHTMMQRLVEARHYVTMSVRLLLPSGDPAPAAGATTVVAGERDSNLAAEIAKLTDAVMSRAPVEGATGIASRANLPSATPCSHLLG